jgi:hypothetical protein
MALLGLRAVLLIIAVYAAYEAHGELGRLCPVADTGAATVCSMDSSDYCQDELLAGDVLITASEEAAWVLGAGLLSFAPGESRLSECPFVLLRKNMLITVVRGIHPQMRM